MGGGLGVVMKLVIFVTDYTIWLFFSLTYRDSPSSNLFQFFCRVKVKVSLPEWH